MMATDYDENWRARAEEKAREKKAVLENPIVLAPNTGSPRPAKPEEPPPDWREIIAARVNEYEYGYNHLGSEAGVSPSVVMRFLKGERDITLATAEKICATLDLVLVRAEHASLWRS
jgi:hypothetical protein